MAVLANEYVFAIGLESPFGTLAGLARGFGSEMKLEVQLGASNVFAMRATHFFLNKNKTVNTILFRSKLYDTRNMLFKGLTPRVST